METRANYLLVGGFVLTFSAALLLFIIWVAKFQFDTLYERYELVFDSQVTGISVGSPVRFQGVSVGEVLEIGFDKNRPGEIIMEIEIDADTPINSTTYASLEMAGLAGGRYVLLSGSTVDGAEIDRPKRGLPRIPTEASSIERLLEGAPDVITNMNELLNRAALILSDENIRSVSRTLKNVEEISDTVAKRQSEIDQIIGDASTTLFNVSEATGNITDMTRDLRENIGSVLEQAEQTLSSIETTSDAYGDIASDNRQEIEALVGDMRLAVASVRRLAEQSEALVAENREPINEFAQTGLYELTLTLSEFRGLIASLNRVSRQLERDPSQFLFGDGQAGYEGVAE